MGAAQETAGRASGNRNMAAAGSARKDEGKLQGTVGKAKDAVGDAADAVKHKLGG